MNKAVGEYNISDIKYKKMECLFVPFFRRMTAGLVNGHRNDLLFLPPHHHVLIHTSKEFSLKNYSGSRKSFYDKNEGEA